MTIALDYKPAQPNPFADHIPGQRIALISSLTFESGHELKSCQVAYKTWGQLNATRDNVLVVCHALTGSSDVADWWAPLMGPGKALDYTRFFVFCGNALGSPYGSSSPLTVNPETGRPYGPEFPPTSVRDDVIAQKLVLDALGVSSVAAVIGGSMGGMATIEWPLCTPPGFVKAVVPIATSVAQSAWGISWSEVQRRCILSDPLFCDGYYEPSQQPTGGLATARMMAMLTYRSAESFEKRFGRELSSQRKHFIPPAMPPACHGSSLNLPAPPPSKTPTHTRQFSAQDYLDYQGAKFLRRFDANCYLHLMYKMDTHDVRRGRVPEGCHPDNITAAVLSRAPSHALVIGIESDVLFVPAQQHELATSLPDARLVMLKSPDGHDAFLLEFDRLNRLIIDRLKSQFPTMCNGFVERIADGDMSRMTNDLLHSFHQFMTTQRVGHVQWLDFYPIEDQLLLGFDSSDPKAVLLVDVGGSVGHEIQAVKKRYPKIPGRMVLQDRPATIERVKPENGMEVMAHDFFTEQPIKGARAYYFRSVLHDWDGDRCREILSHIKNAMKPGYSGILINEFSIPLRGACTFATHSDFFVMSVNAAVERTKKQWYDLIESVGLKIDRSWTLEPDSESILEVSIPE